MTFRKARLSDTDSIMEIIAQAKAQMKSRGSMQWQGPYPARENIEKDIDAGYGYVLCDSSGITAYAAIIAEPEQAYMQIDGNWLCDGSYIVVHRLAVHDRAKNRGVATRLMTLAEGIGRSTGQESIRADTSFDNEFMLRMLGKLGFAYCGRIIYDSGVRMAFEKPLAATSSPDTAAPYRQE